MECFGFLWLPYCDFSLAGESFTESDDQDVKRVWNFIWGGWWLRCPRRLVSCVWRNVKTSNEHDGRKLRKQFRRIGIHDGNMENGNVNSDSVKLIYLDTPNWVRVVVVVQRTIKSGPNSFHHESRNPKERWRPYTPRSCRLFVMTRFWQIFDYDAPPFQTYPGGIIASLRSNQLFQITNCVVGAALDSYCTSQSVAQQFSSMKKSPPLRPVRSFAITCKLEWDKKNNQ